MSSVHTRAVVSRPAVVLPENVFTRESLKDTARKVLAGHPHLPRVLRIIENTGIQTRHLVRPIEETVTPVGFGERNNRFIETSKRLGEKCALEAVKNAGLAVSDIDF
ncbi:MAG TPA: type III polyketide synthase, partial [Myxococcota bacterium]